MRLFVWILAFSALIACGKEPTKPETPAGKRAAAGTVPDVDDIANPPGLFPSPSDTPVRGLSEMGQPTMAELDAAAEVLWGSILRTEKQDAAIVRALDGIKVLVSGVMEVEGEEQLYLGIDEKDFNKHDIEHLRTVLKSRFPAIPIFIEASEGVTLLRDMGGEDEEFVDVFADDFSEGIDGWDTGTPSDGWQAETFSYPVPNEQAGNKVAVATSERCSADCVITTEAIDLSGYTSATLSFHRWVDDGLSGGEFLAVEVGSNGAYQRLETWEDDDGDDVWRYKTYTLDEKYLGEAITIRFITRLGVLDLSSLFDNSTPAEKIVAIDNVTVQGAQETQEEEEESLPDIAVYNVSASPTTVETGTSVNVRFSVQNNGTAPSSMKNVRIYRHRSLTSTPKRGGSEAARIPMFTPGSNASLTRTLSASTPTVSSTTTFYYYVCIDAIDGEEKTDNNCGGPAVVRVRAKSDDSADTQTSALNIISVLITPAVIKSGDTITIQTVLLNEGSAQASSRVVQAYQQTTATGDPGSGTQVGSATTTGNIAAGESKTVTVTFTAPTTTEETYYYYAVCFGDLCTPLFPTMIRPKETTVVNNPVNNFVDNGPPYEDCHDVPERDTPMGGDVMLAERTDNSVGCGTITLGGLETKDGIKGFVVSAHVISRNSVDHRTYTATDVFVRHGRYTDQNGKTGPFLGKVLTMPYLHVVDEDINEYRIDADAAFVAYPSQPTAGCSLTWEDNGESFCLDVGIGNQIERVNPLTIRGENGSVYTVIGSHQPKIGENVLVAGAVSGAGAVGGRIDGKLLVSGGDLIVHAYKVSVNTTSTIGGDSGGPVYTTPDTNGNIRITGIVQGRVGTDTVFSPWHDVAKTLNLKPID